MLNLKRMLATRSAKRSASTSPVGRPGSTLRATVYSPPSISCTCRSLTATPWLRAKPSAALVGCPSQKAALAGGPLTHCSTSVWCGARFLTNIANRRGVPSTRISPCDRRNSSSSLGTAVCSCSRAVSRSVAGSSSVPISNRNASGSGENSPASTTARVSTLKVGPCFNHGWPISSRWAR